MATGSYQMNIGTDNFLAASQVSASKAITEVVDVLNNPDIFNQFVHFPQNLEEMRILRNGFYETFNFPGVIGCLDCMHVAIFPPPVEDQIHPECIYINRKGYHSINVQLICDWKLKILNVNARYHGSCHDSFIWNNSNVKLLLENLHRNGHSDFYLLADSGYALRPWCLTPLEQDVEQNSPEDRYNKWSFEDEVSMIHFKSFNVYAQHCLSDIYYLKNF